MKTGWVREPILIFFVIGILLFVWPSSEPESQIINIDRASLIRFIENRTRNFSGSVSESFDELSDAAIMDAVDQYNREETLYRKALALGLDREDYVIRRRLVQRVEYLSQGQIIHEPGDAELRTYYLENQALFAQLAKVTFTHVYFSEARNGKTARKQATSALEELRSGKVRFDQAPGYGERFLYHLNYVDKSAEEIKSHFGAEMTASLFALAPGDRWQGPLRSTHGYHLVMLTDRIPAYVEEFAASKALVRTRWMAQQQQLQQEASVTATMAEYQVELSEELKDRLGASFRYRPSSSTIR